MPTPFRLRSLLIVLVALALGVEHGAAATSAPPALETFPLPGLTIDGQTARAHTQGMDLGRRHLFVTARRDDVEPRQALLLRLAPSRKEWTVWNITPISPGRVLDHPGGFQSDGRRLWIPIAESRRNGRTLIQAFRESGLRPGERPQPESQFEVADHIGALAVDRERRLLFGASWDTASVYVWDFDGRLDRVLTSEELRPLGLGAADAAGRRPGLAVQDWKWRDGRLWASGLRHDLPPGGGATTQRSQLLILGAFPPGPSARSGEHPLPGLPGIEVAHEAMTLDSHWLWFLPEDLGAGNRVLRVRHGLKVR